MKVIAVIPARLGSTRLPRKMLREIGGRPLVTWVYKAVRACSRLDDVIGSAGYRGPARSLADMERAIAKGVKARHGRGRH